MDDGIFNQFSDLPGVHTVPSVTYHPTEGQWELTSDLFFCGYGINLLILLGFRTDLASIPRILWRIIAPFELSILGPVIHDFLYRNGGRYVTTYGVVQQVSRETTDKLFLNVMADEGVSWWRRVAAYHAVRMFGKSSWRTK